MDKQEDTQKYLGGLKNKTREERIIFLKEKEKKLVDGCVASLTVCLKNGTPIGFTNLIINEQENNAELSYIYDSDYWGNGYCTEVCNTLINIAFNELKLNAILADTVESNLKSQRVLEKLNFSFVNSRIEANGVKFLNYVLLRNNYK